MPEILDHATSDTGLRHATGDKRNQVKLQQPQPPLFRHQLQQSSTITATMWTTIMTTWSNGHLCLHADPAYMILFCFFAVVWNEKAVDKMKHETQFLISY